MRVNLVHTYPVVLINTTAVHKLVERHFACGGGKSAAAAAL